MNELYRLLQNVQEIAIANNQFLKIIEQRLSAIEAKLTIEKTDTTSEPNAVGEERNIEE